MKLPHQLKISNIEFALLLATRALLLSKEVKHEADPERALNTDVDYDNMLKLPKTFNMNKTCVAKKCGTAACIGGWMALLGGCTTTQAVSDYVSGREHIMGQKRSPALEPLFFPPRDQVNEAFWEEIKPTHAVKAIDYFLETGKVDWRKALPNKMHARNR